MRRYLGKLGVSSYLLGRHRLLPFLPLAKQNHYAAYCEFRKPKLVDSRLDRISFLFYGNGKGTNDHHKFQMVDAPRFDGTLLRPVEHLAETV